MNFKHYFFICAVHLSNHIRNQIETDADAEVQASINRKRPKQ